MCFSTIFHRSAILLTLLLPSGCIFGDGFFFRGQTPNPHNENFLADRYKTITIVGHGWHTGIILETSDISREQWPEIGQFSNRRFVEVGWGDEGFYRSPKITLPLIMKAVTIPTPTVLHVVGFDPTPQQVFPASDLIEIELKEDEFRNLCRFIHDSYAHDAAGQPIVLGPGLYGGSYFYRAKGNYYYPNTCNVWTAKALKSAGKFMIPTLATTAGAMLSQAKRHGRVINKSSPFAMIQSLQAHNAER